MVKSVLHIGIRSEYLTGWYCKAFKSIGEGRYKMCADAARKGNKPMSLFGWLLKRELEKSNG